MSTLLLLMLGLPLVMLLLLGLTALRIGKLLWLAPLPALALALAGGLDLNWTVRIGGWAFALDRPAALLLGASALIWCAAGACAARIQDKRFAMWWLLTLWGSLGVFAAADLVSFYLLYAAASLPAYGLIVWGGGEAEQRAGRLTLAAALAGEALLLAAFVLLAAGAPGQSLLIGDCVAALATSPFRDGVIALVILGFGLKIGLVPQHGWMPLSYASGPLAATAALSGATSKAGIIGLILFLPFDAGLQGWGMALLAAGLFAAFYGVVIGLFQSNPRSVLAYSSISQLGQMAAVLGAGLATANPSAALMVGFYGLYHVLVKGGLFLAMDGLGRGGMRRLTLVTAAIAALGFAGLPLAGGALAKLAVKPVIGDGWADLLFTLAACGSALLMLHFIRLIRNIAPEAEAGDGAWRAAWLLIFAAAMLLPWLLFAGVTGLPTSYALRPDVIMDLGWPVTAGLVIGLGLAAMGWLAMQPTLVIAPRGDAVAAAADTSARVLSRGVERLVHFEGASRQWTVSSSLLIFVFIIFTILSSLGGR